MPLDDRPAVPPRPLYADVIVPRHIAKTFTYLIPTALAQTLEIGQRVVVPFGRTMLEGAVVSLSDHPPPGIVITALKEIRSLAKGAREAELSSVLFELSRKIAERYVAPWGQCLRLVFSANPAPSPSSLRYVVTDLGRGALDTGNCPENLRPTLQRIARRSGGLLCATLLDSRTPSGRAAIDALEDRTWITVVGSQGGEGNPSVRTVRTSGVHADRSDLQRQVALSGVLPEPDSRWVAHVAECLRANHVRRILLQAPWEHRVSWLADAIRQAQRLNKSVLILAGEVAKAEWLGQRLSSLTGAPIAVLHPPSDHDARAQDQSNRPSVVVGTRTAIFTPLRSIGLIWVDGEDDPAFKEPQEPRFHARDAARLRAEAEQALLVLASAHPSLEARMDTGAESYAVHPEAAGRPGIELVDLHDEPGGTLLGEKLLAAMQDALERKTGVLLFLNRKGYAGALVCRDCGGVPRCASCAVALAYYREAGRLMCRYCGTKAPLPDSCPNCRAARLSPVGEGTERVEIEARRLFPRVKIGRLDGDTLRRSSSARRLWEGVYSGVWDILIGTQALFQRAPIPSRGLVGIIQADSGLNVPDFRAAERTYHLLVEAVSAACPASEGGRVVLQTWLPAHHAVQAVMSGDPNRFYDEELTARRLLGYPPACHLASLVISGKEARMVEAAAQEWKQTLAQATDGSNALAILGPAPTTGGRRNGRHRLQILAKGADRAFLCGSVRHSIEKLEPAYRKTGVKFVVDVDPVEMS